MESKSMFFTDPRPVCLCTSNILLPVYYTSSVSQIQRVPDQFCPIQTAQARHQFIFFGHMSSSTNNACLFHLLCRPAPLSTPSSKLLVVFHKQNEMGLIPVPLISAAYAWHQFIFFGHMSFLTNNACLLYLPCRPRQHCRLSICSYFG